LYSTIVKNAIVFSVDISRVGIVKRSLFYL